MRSLGLFREEKKQIRLIDLQMSMDLGIAANADALGVVLLVVIMFVVNSAALVFRA